MYAVMETGGKQYRVEYGKELHVELLDATPGSEVTFDRVLLVRTDDATQVGAPIVAGAKVTALSKPSASRAATWSRPCRVARSACCGARSTCT